MAGHPVTRVRSYWREKPSEPALSTHALIIWKVSRQRFESIAEADAIAPELDFRLDSNLRLWIRLAILRAEFHRHRARRRQLIAGLCVMVPIMGLSVALSFSLNIDLAVVGFVWLFPLIGLQLIRASLPVRWRWSERVQGYAMVSLWLTFLGGALLFSLVLRISSVRRRLNARLADELQVAADSITYWWTAAAIAGFAFLITRVLIGKLSKHYFCRVHPLIALADALCVCLNYCVNGNRRSWPEKQAAIQSLEQAATAANRVILSHDYRDPASLSWATQQAAMIAANIRFIKRWLATERKETAARATERVTLLLKALYENRYDDLRVEELDLPTTPERFAVLSSRVRSIFAGALPLILIVLLRRLDILTPDAARTLYLPTGTLAALALIVTIDPGLRTTIKSVQDAVDLLRAGVK